MQSDCRECGGKGHTFAKPCKPCGGKGNVPSTKKIAIEIPKGIENGAKIRVSGQGSTSKSHRGDLYVFVTVRF